MMKKYDLVFGLGSACSCSQALRAAGLQFESFPFDWNTCQADDDLLARADLIRTDFAHWLDKDDLSFFSHNFERDSMDVYTNSRTKFVFIHDFEKGVPFDTALPRVAEKYNRRITRLYDRIRASRRVLLVRIDTPSRTQLRPTSVESCQAALAVISKKFPEVTFDLMLVTLARGVPLRKRRVESIGSHMTHISFDYSVQTPGAPDFLTYSKKLAVAIKALASARDYRAPAQKRAFELKQRQKRWAKYGAANHWQYLCARLKKHLHL